MRLACRLTNGDGIGFDYATVELTPDYVAYLFRLVAEAKRLKESDDSFCEIESLDFAAQYGASLGVLETRLPESDTGDPWVEVPEDFQWPADSEQSIAASTVVVTGKTIVWRALGAHDYGGPYFETEELQVEQLRRLFPQQAADASHTETRRYILFDHDMGSLATTTVYDDYEDAAEDASRLNNVVVLALAFETEGPSEPDEQPDGPPTLPHARDYVDAGGGFCPKCRSEQVEGDSADFDGAHCTQRMRCLQCDAVWFDVYMLSSVEPQDD